MSVRKKRSKELNYGRLESERAGCMGEEADEVE